MKINYSILLYLLCIPLGYDFPLSADDNFSALRTLFFMIALLMTLYGGFLNAKHQMKYRSVLWMFFVNLLLILGYIISNGGTGNSSLFGGDDWSLGFFLMEYWLNMHWTYLSFINLPWFSSDFTFLLILMCSSFLFPSIGFLIGKFWCKR
ncbi:MAG: hypothetical protein L0G39_07400 [Chryseobacterium sp.]|nr:hypothetical protein [Chryseobacterium sp.]